MKTKVFGLILLATIALTGLGVAEPTATQVTGALVAMSDSTLTILNGEERVEISRNAETKGANGLKVGDKVTVTYTITPSNAKLATSVNLKADKEARAEDPSATVFPPKK